ncbi:MAG: class I fructose-bisphosphate aldolase [Candidatus Poseidoniales archaeon]
MDIALLEATAAALVAPGKGILAADESNGTMSNRLEGVGLESSEEARRAYRANLFATPGCESAVSGVILYDETIRQSMDDGTPIPDYLNSRGILPGIKVDTGTVDLEGYPGEKTTKGIEAEPENEWADLGTRCAEYFEMGARFAKWRAVIKVETGYAQHGPVIPSKQCLSENANALAKYAKICQDAGLVPIIEPEVLMDGTHDAMDCAKATHEIFEATWAACKEQDVHLPGALLKPNMIVNGRALKREERYFHRDQATKDRIAKAAEVLGCRADEYSVAMDTLVTFLGYHGEEFSPVPWDIGGIVFLSGGLSDRSATAHLSVMNSVEWGSILPDGTRLPEKPPWQLSYSYGRALQASALKSWAEDGAEASQAAFAHRAKMNSLARSGDWDISLE